MPLAEIEKPATEITDLFEDFVRNAAFPCVGAKSALNKGQMHFVVADDIRSAWDDLRIWPKIASLANSYRNDPVLFQTLVVIFRNNGPLTRVSAAIRMTPISRSALVARPFLWLVSTPMPAAPPGASAIR